ncbi:MAG: RNA polymerase sigma-70 factor [Rikenellaceae bacterium]
MSEREVISAINRGDQTIYKYLYDTYYYSLFVVARGYVRDDQIAESLVSDLFVKIWERTDDLVITTSLTAYLMRSIRNLSINYLQCKWTKSRVSIDGAHEASPLEFTSHDTPLGILLEREMEQKINNLINAMPQETQEVFKLSRSKSLKYTDIALQLGTSQDNVKYHMKRALFILRKALLAVSWLLLLR